MKRVSREEVHAPEGDLTWDRGREMSGIVSLRKDY